MTTRLLSRAASMGVPPELTGSNQTELTGSNQTGNFVF